MRKICEFDVLCALATRLYRVLEIRLQTLKKHLETVHKHTDLVEKEVPGSNARGKRKKPEDSEASETSRPKKQCTLVGTGVPSTRLRNLLSEYVIEDVLPLSTVESAAFRKLIGGICSTQVPDRKSFTAHMDKLYDAMVKKVKEILETVDFVSTTADVWTAHNRSYLGMTVHWINPITLKRCKAAIACIRVTGHHTYDALAEKIEHVHASYGLTGKVTATVTDNASNFVKAFTVFHQLPQDSSSVSTDAAIPVIEENSEETEQDTDTEEVTFENLDELLTLDEASDFTQVQYDLPPHQRCAAHTLNLVASTDIDKYLSSSTISRSVYRSSFAKCAALWNKASRSTIASETVQEITKRKLLVPSPTRWNSYYHAVLRVTENSIAEINELCTRMEIRCFAEREITFLKEYCTVLEPLSRGLDILQGEDDCFFGTLLPTLETIIKKITAMRPKLSSMTIGLVGLIESSLKRRFGCIFGSKDATIAAISLPKFKLRWIDDQTKKDQLKQMFIQEIRLHRNDDVAESQVEQTEPSSKKDFYEFDSDEDNTTQSTVESEVNDYLSNAKRCECLNKYPTIKRVFLEYTTIPSSAPVERLFSLGNLVLTPKRNRLTDARFEKMLLMRYNKDFLVM